MRGFTNKDPEHKEALEQVRQWTRARFGLPADAVILVAEIACGLPGCPPLETVVVFWLGEKRHKFKIFKRLAEVALDDLPPAWLRDVLAGSEVVEFGCC
jgi:nitrate reductase delta subunit